MKTDKLISSEIISDFGREREESVGGRSDEKNRGKDEPSLWPRQFLAALPYLFIGLLFAMGEHLILYSIEIFKSLFIGDLHDI